VALLEVSEIDAHYGRIQALRKLSLDVDKGEIVALIGSNGAGKTTTLRTISGLMHPGNGTIKFDGNDITRTGPEKIVDLGICQSPEGRRLFPRMTVMDNLMMGAYTRRDAAQIKTDAEHVFELFPRLKERRNQVAGTLSGGEQQMLAVARALMLRPRLMLLDEPSFGLAPLIVRDLFKILGKINRDDKVTILVVEQNAQLALELADTAYVIETGRIVMSGKASDIANNEDVRKSYLGY